MSEQRSDATHVSPPRQSPGLMLDGEQFEPTVAETLHDAARWRKSARERLIAARLKVSVDERGRIADEVSGVLDRLIGCSPGRVVAVYWPVRGEPDLRPWMVRKTMRGMRIALPVVPGNGQPLLFRELRPDSRMGRGVWDIPIPLEGHEVVPDVVIAPLVGYDHDGYRLGYGGGYNRTLSALLPRPLFIGVGCPGTALETVWPQPDDIPMDAVVTGAEPVQLRANRG